MTTEETTIGDEIATTDEVNQAAYGVFSEIGLAIGNEAAFVLRDKLAAELAEWINNGGAPYGLDVDAFAIEMSDWMSGSGVISCYTATQVEQWADMGLWACDLGDAWQDWLTADRCAETSPAELIGKELAFVAYELAHAMGTTANEVLEERQDEGDE